MHLLDEISRGHAKLYAKKDYFRASMRGEEQLIRSQTRCDNIQHVSGRRETGCFEGTFAAGESSPSAANFASSQVSTPFNHDPKAGPKTFCRGMLTSLVPIIIGSLYK